MSNTEWREIYDEKNNQFKDGAEARLLDMSHAAVDAVKRFMQRNARDIKANQLRNIHARLQQAIAAGNTDRLPVLRIKLAYIKGKSHHRSRGYHDLLDLMDGMITRIEGPEGLPKLATFFEAVLAYHKYYENVKTR